MVVVKLNEASRRLTVKLAKRARAAACTACYYPLPVKLELAAGLIPLSLPVAF